MRWAQVAAQAYAWPPVSSWRLRLLAPFVRCKGGCGACLACVVGIGVHLPVDLQVGQVHGTELCLHPQLL